MRIRPILFNTDMVRAILDGRKTATRRIVKQQHLKVLDSQYHKDHPEVPDARLINRLCPPPYETGDVLYVRETWHKDISRYMYRANYADNEKFYQNGKETEIKWHPSIHMPKEAARIWLRVTDVRVERLQEITDEQAEKEGIRGYSKDGKLYKYAVSDNWWIDYHGKHRRLFTGSLWQDMPRTAKEAFFYLWSSTLKKFDLDRYGWDANPWVWVIEFERCEKPEATDNTI